MAATALQINANLGFGEISSANPYLDGSGSTSLCFTAASANNTSVGGSYITAVKIKSTASTTLQGMVRLFIYDGHNYFLFKEICVPPTQQSSVLPTFRETVPCNLRLDSGYQIFASTENSDPFNIFVYGLDFGYADCSHSLNDPAIKKVSNTGLVTINTANPYIDGSGTLGTLITAISASPGDNIGTVVKRIVIKAQETTTQGMVRLFIYDPNGNKTYLWAEVEIPARTQSSVVPAVELSFPAKLLLNPDCVLYASTENAQIFNIVADAVDFSCCGIDS